MALNATTLSAAIVAAWTADPKCGFSSPLTTAQRDIIKALADGVASAVVAHITSSAVVAGTATGAISGGPGVPVVGTIT
jgi:hypothetical protein